MIIGNINLNLAFDEIIQANVKGKSLKEIRACNTDVYSQIYQVHKLCDKLLKAGKPQIVDVMRNDKTYTDNPFISADNELLLKVTPTTPKLSTKLVRKVVDVQTYLKFLPDEKKEKNSHLCGSYDKIDNFLIKGEQITLIPKSYQFNKGGNNDS
jgi:hypothetical protein